MEDPSIFSYNEKLLLEETMRELELTKNVNVELLKMLNTANRERDEAKEQLQFLLNNINNNNNNLVMIQPTKANSSITESNSMSHVSSPIDSIFETVSSHQEFSNVDVVDVGSARIDDLVNGKVLPQKGKLLEAVKNAGPLLKNLILAGPLPTWKNPPPLNSFDHLNNNSFPNTLNSFQLNGVYNNNTCLLNSNSGSTLKRQRLF